jgi:hypothetical protein
VVSRYTLIETEIKDIKQCKPIISNQLTSLINLSIDTGVFPDSLKKAQVTPLHKKNDPLYGSPFYRYL